MKLISLSGMKKQANACIAVATSVTEMDKFHQKAGNALYGNRNGENVNVNQNNANNHNDNRGFRCALRVYWLCTAFIHPPSILPISANMLCVWKIFVSFAIFNSSTRRNFNTETSSILLAFIRYALLKVFGAFFAIIK